MPSPASSWLSTSRFSERNALKIAHGGWLPLVIGALLFTLMTTWKTGRQIVAQRLTARAVPLEDFMARVADSEPARVPGTAVFMTAQPHGTPPALAHNLQYNKVLHERVITLMVTTQPVPHVPRDEQIVELGVQTLMESMRRLYALHSLRLRVAFRIEP